MNSEKPWTAEKGFYKKKYLKCLRRFFLINWFYNLDIHIFVFYNMALFSSVMALTNSFYYFNSDEKYHGLSYGIIDMLSTDMKIKKYRN